MVTYIFCSLLCVYMYNKHSQDNRAGNPQSILNASIKLINREIVKRNEKNAVATTWLNRLVHSRHRKTYMNSYHRLQIDGCHLSPEVRNMGKCPKESNYQQLFNPLDILVMAPRCLHYSIEGVFDQRHPHFAWRVVHALQCHPWCTCVLNIPIVFDQRPSKDYPTVSFQFLNFTTTDSDD